jgi:hypothetical protein
MKKVFITGLTALAVLGLSNISLASGGPNSGPGGNSSNVDITTIVKKSTDITAQTGGVVAYQAPAIGGDVEISVAKAVANQNGKLLVFMPGLSVGNDVSVNAVSMIDGAAADAAAAAAGQGGASHPGVYTFGGQGSGAGSAAADAAAAAAHSINSDVIAKASGIFAASNVNLNIDMSNVAIANSGTWVNKTVAP